MAQQLNNARMKYKLQVMLMLGAGLLFMSSCKTNYEHLHDALKTSANQAKSTAQGSHIERPFKQFEVQTKRTYKNGILTAISAVQQAATDYEYLLANPPDNFPLMNLEAIKATEEKLQDTTTTKPVKLAGVIQKLGNMSQEDIQKVLDAEAQLSLILQEVYTNLQLGQAALDANINQQHQYDLQQAKSAYQSAVKHLLLTVYRRGKKADRELVEGLLKP